MQSAHAPVHVFELIVDGFIADNASCDNRAGFGDDVARDRQRSAKM
jgi:hypothetical protein